MHLRRLFCSLFFAFSSAASAVSLPDGLEFEPTTDLDLTYQVIPAYDEKEKVIARWQGDDLQYFVVLMRLPPEYTQPKIYLHALIQSLKQAWGRIEAGEYVSYDAAPGFKGTAIAIDKPASGDDAALHQVYHFVTNGNASFAGVVSPVAKGFAPADLLAETQQVMQGIHLAAPGQAQLKREYEGAELVGDWNISSMTSNGEEMLAKLHLNDDMTFTTRITLDGRQVMAGNGAWHRKGDQLYWTHLYTVPALPQGAREDVDTIVSEAPGRLMLQTATGKEQIMERAGER